MSAAPKINSQIEIKLTVLKGPHAGQSFVLNKQSFSIGRGPENEIILLNDAKISRQHAQIQVVGQDIEILNLSPKNQVFVGSESIQKWKLTNESVFKLGDSEIIINYDIGHVVMTAHQVPKSIVSNQSIPVEVITDTSSDKTHISAKSLPLTPQQIPQKISSNLPKAGSVNAVSAQMHITAQTNQGFYAPPPPAMQNTHRQMGTPQGGNFTGFPPIGNIKNKNHFSGGILSHPKARFYLVVGLVLTALIYWLNDTPPAKKNKEVKSTLKYEDEFFIKQNSQAEKDLELKRKKQLDQVNSPTYQRIQENYQKGMRDFYLANYSRAMDYFQVVLNLDPNHVQARRQLFLAKARFDEVLKAKLILGESYYQKHNFKMCEAMYQQVIVMLQGKSNDRSYQIAQSMKEKCRLASEGIR